MSIRSKRAVHIISLAIDDKLSSLSVCWELLTFRVLTSVEIEYLRHPHEQLPRTSIKASYPFSGGKYISKC